MEEVKEAKTQRKVRFEAESSSYLESIDEHVHPVNFLKPDIVKQNLEDRNIQKVVEDKLNRIPPSP